MEPPADSVSQARVIDWAMKMTIMRCLLGSVLCACIATAAALDQRERTVQSVLPALTYGSHCSMAVEWSNLGDRPVILGVEGHKGTGALVPLTGQAAARVHLKPAEHASYKLDIADESQGAWIKVAEVVPSPQLSPVVAVSGTTECIAGDQLRSTMGQLAYPTPNPWFSGDISEIASHEILIINTSADPARAWLCYSEGNLYAVPGSSQRASQLTPICSAEMLVQLPPFSTRQFPVQREDSSFFALKTAGTSIVLQMLRPAEADVKIYTVNSTVHFGDEAPVVNSKP